MSQDFTKSNPALEAKIAACRSAEEIQETLLAFQQASGQPTKFDRVALSESFSTMRETAAVVAAPKNEGQQLFRRAVTVDGVTRLLEAYSVGGLDFLERELRGKHI